MLTNKFNLPKALIRAISNDSYTRGASDISVTQLITPPYQRKLAESVERVEDAIQRIWSLLGTSVHHMIERAAEPGSIQEERLFAEVNGWTVSGQMDLIEDGVLIDFKVTSVWSAINGGKIEWEQQLNLLRYLALKKFRQTGDYRYDVKRLMIIAIFRDWVQSKAGVDGYPEAQAGVIEIPLWSEEKAAKYLEERVAAHQAAEPQPCTDEERWATPEVFALMKEGRKSAVRLYPSIEEAEQAMGAANDSAKGKHHVERRRKTFRRCESYCSVSHACPHYNSNPAGEF